MWLWRTLDARSSRTLADLGVYLRDELNRCVDSGQRATNASGLHIGAFETRNGAAKPVMQYVANQTLLSRHLQRSVSPPGLRNAKGHAKAVPQRGPSVCSTGVRRRESRHTRSHFYAVGVYLSRHARTLGCVRSSGFAFGWRPVPDSSK
jgi:hypothetical protein